MKKLVLLSTIAAMGFASQAFAQARNFEGFDLQISTGYQQFSLNPKDVTIENINRGINTKDTSKSGVPLILGAGYTAALGDAFTLGAALDYYPITSQLALSVVPGYAFTEQTQGYIKLGWAYAATTLEPFDGAAKINTYLNGPMIGLGAKMLFTDNFYGFMEANYISYSSATFNTSIQNVTVSGKTNNEAYSFLVGVGYKF